MVDFYFILTGAFTYKHFINCPFSINLGDEALCYTFNKFKRFFVLTIISVTIMCFVRRGRLLLTNDWNGFLHSIGYAPFEMIYLSSSGLVETHNPPLWFLSAMFITLPVIVYLMQAHRELWKILAFVLPILYFGHNGVNTERVWPNDLMRAFACMSLGTLSYIFSEKIRKYVSTSIKIKMILSAIMIACLTFGIYIGSGKIWS